MIDTAVGPARTLHARLRERAAESRGDSRLWLVVGPLLELHKPGPYDEFGECCHECAQVMPCTSLILIAEGLGVDPRGC